MKKVLLLVGLVLGMGLVSCKMNTEENNNTYSFVPGWYKFEGEGVKEPLYFEYDYNEKIIKAGTMEDPVLEQQFAIVQDTYKFSRVHNQLSFMKEPDEMTELPKWVYSNTAVSYKYDNNLISGFNLSDGVTKSTEFTDIDPTFTFTTEGSSVDYKTFYYHKENNDIYRALNTVSKPRLHINVQNEEAKKYLTFVNADGTDVSVYDSPVLSNDMKIVCKTLPATEKTYTFTVINKDKFIPSKNFYEEMFNVTVTLKPKN